MITAVERAARALWEISGRPLKVHEVVPNFTVPEDEPDLERFLPQVMAVLLAMRDPSEEMSEAGGEVIRGVTPGESDQAHRSDAANTWRFMIDAALSERFAK